MEKMIAEDKFRQMFCENLNRLIKEKNVTQRDVANFVGVSYPTVNHWVKGNKIPRMDKIDKLCSFFLCTRSDLLEYKKDTKEQYNNILLNDHDRYMVEAYNKADDIIKDIVDNALNNFSKVDLKSLSDRKKRKTCNAG